MNWPTSQDYNEAIQNASSFSDPTLKSGEATVNAIGLPVPRSGNFADVYQFKGGDGKTWALKCFTRKVAGLQERYAKIDEHIGKANFPFTVGFNYLAEGIRIRGQWFPLLKMEWVEGFTLNEFVRNNAGKPQYLHALMQMWAKLCARLRDGNFAHADLQHGNVLLVPGDTQNKLGLKLIDYDGMWVPALAEVHSGEVGHPNFQHPMRLKDRLYNADVDRFPHLMIATALRATLLGGRVLWDQFDNGDNLLFKEADLRDPANAPIFKTLWDKHDDVLCALVGKLALASRDPLRKTPWLDDILLDKGGLRLNLDEEERVIQLLGVGPHFTVSKVAAVPVALAAPVAHAFGDFAALDDEEDRKAAARWADQENTKPTQTEENETRPKKTKSLSAYSIGGGVLAAALLIGVVVLATGGKTEPGKLPEVAKNDRKTDVPPTRTEESAKPKIIVASPSKKDLKKDNADTAPPKKDSIKDDPDTTPPKKVKVDADPAVPIAVELKDAWTSKYKTDSNGLSFTPDSKRLLTVGGPEIIQILDAETGDVVDQVTDKNQAIRIATAGPGDSLIVGRRTGNSFVWDLKGNTKRFDLVGAYSRPFFFTEDYGGAVLVPDNTHINFIALGTGELRNTLNTSSSSPLSAVLASQDGSTILALNTAGSVIVRTATDKDFRTLLNLGTAGYRNLSLSLDGKLFAVCCRNDPILIGQTSDGSVHSKLEGHSNDPIAAAFTKDDQHVVSIGRDNSLRLWEAATGKELQNVKPKCGFLSTLALSPDGRWVAIGGPNAIQMLRLIK